LKDVDYPHMSVGHGVGIVIHVDLADVGLLPLQIQFIHMILLGFHHIDGLVMDGGEGAFPVHFGDNDGFPVTV